MRCGVLHVNKSTLTSTSPTMRIAKFVAQQLDCPFIYDLESAKKYQKVKFDVLFTKYGMLKFSDHRDEGLEIYSNARRVINMENDYTFVPDKRFRTADETWSTVEGRTRYVNWNVLTRHGTDGWNKKPSVEPTERGLIYYGAHRQDRVPYFEKYLKNAPYPVTVSTFRGKKSFFETCGEKINVIGAFRGPDDPAKWEMTVYVEDTTSHDLYCSPANRFYECLHMGLPQAVDEKAAMTLVKARVEHVDEFVVGNKRDLKKLMSVADDVRRRQQKFWRRDYSKDLIRDFKKAVKESKV